MYVKFLHTFEAAEICEISVSSTCSSSTDCIVTYFRVSRGFSFETISLGVTLTLSSRTCLWSSVLSNFLSEGMPCAGCCVGSVSWIPSSSWMDIWKVCQTTNTWKRYIDRYRRKCF